MPWHVPTTYERYSSIYDCLSQWRKPQSLIATKQSQTGILKKHHLTILACAISLAASISTGCKPSEKHYREAYETTIKARHTGEDEYLDSVARAAMQTGGRPVVTHIGDSTLQYRIEWIRPAVDKTSASAAQPKTTPTHATPGRPSPSAKPYCIIVGQFKQRFNAREMCTRLQGYGYAHAMVFQSSEPRYFVAADTVSSPEAALRQLDSIKADKRLLLKAPFPTVIQPAQRAY